MVQRAWGMLQGRGLALLAQVVREGLMEEGTFYRILRNE